MNWWKELVFVIRRLDRRRAHSELNEEIQNHLQLEIEQNVRDGMTQEEARYAALRTFGSVALTNEGSRDMWGFRTFEVLIQDLRFGFRLLLKSPGFAAVAILSLALGIGANTAIFTLFNAAILRPLPVNEPDKLVKVLTGRASGLSYNYSYPAYTEIRDNNPVFDGVIAHSGVSVGLGANDQTQIVEGEVVSANYFSVLGVKPALGRDFAPDENKYPNANPVVILGYGLWQTRFSGDRNLIGQTVKVNGNNFVVIGIAPKSFSGMKPGTIVNLWAPIMMHGQLGSGIADINSRGGSWLYVTGRLKPNVSMQRAQSGLEPVFRQMQETNPRPSDLRLVVETARQGFSSVGEQIGHPLKLLLGAVALIMLIACANVANLMLAKGSVRRREVAVRLALGASRTRLVRQLLTEALLLSLIGGAVGLFIAYESSGLVLAYVPTGFESSITLDLSPDLTVLGFTLALSLATGIVCGLVPSLQASKPELVPALKDETNSSGKRTRAFGLRNALVVSQVALSLVLLVGAGLFIRTLQKLKSLDLGFSANNVLLASVDLKQQKYSRTTGTEFYREFVERVTNIPGVRSASLASVPPVNAGGSRNSIYIDGYTPVPDEDMELNFNVVGLNYFSTLGIPLVRGRDFNQRDVTGAPRVIVINETMAHRYWPNQDVIGRKIKLDDENGPALEIIGVAKDGKYREMREAPRPSFYASLLQTYRPSMTLHVRSEGNPVALVSALQAEVRALNKDLPLFDIKTIADQIDKAMMQERLATALCVVLASLALVLASAGIYGVMSYSVSSRTHEIGIRMALGARPIEALMMVLKESMATVAVGIVIGMVAAYYLTGVLTSLLFNVSPTDPLTFGAIALLLALVALIAGYIPARRAAKVDPMIALRYD